MVVVFAAAVFVLPAAVAQDAQLAVPPAWELERPQAAQLEVLAVSLTACGAGAAAGCSARACVAARSAGCAVAALVDSLGRVAGRSAGRSAGRFVWLTALGGRSSVAGVRALGCALLG